MKIGYLHANCLPFKDKAKQVMFTWDKTTFKYRPLIAGIRE